MAYSDENNLSLVTFITSGIHRIVFPGDIERAGWLELLKNPFFVTNGFCEEVLKLCPRSTHHQRQWGGAGR